MIPLVNYLDECILKIGIFHGYNLTGSGSNEYTRYLAKTFLAQGHTVHIICREFQPEKIEFVGQLEHPHIEW